jgi:agmatinase
MPEALNAIEETAARAMNLGVPIMLGGEHTATIGAVRAAHARYSDLIVVQVDAHTDLRDTYDGTSLSHATIMRRVAEIVGIERIVQGGIRSGTREEFQLARSCLSSRCDLQLGPDVLRALVGTPVYLTIDIDGLDSAVAPGTGCPEPGGPSFLELQTLIATLARYQVVAVDIMEVLPAVDCNDITAIAAAKLVRETALAFGTRPLGRATAHSSGLSAGHDPHRSDGAPSA